MAIDKNIIIEMNTKRRLILKMNVEIILIIALIQLFKILS